VLKVQVLGEAGTTGTVSVAGIDFFASFTIPASGISIIEVPETAMLTADDGTSDLAVEVTADQPVVVYGVHVVPQSVESFLGLPLGSLGMDYSVMAYPPGSFETQFAIVATADGTTVNV
jgi:hypothetical protein